MTVAAHPASSSLAASLPAGSVLPAPGRSLRLPSLYSYLKLVPDPRSAQGRRHPLPALLAQLCLAGLCGFCGYTPAAEWGAALSPQERRALGFTHPKAPVASTFFEVLNVVSWEALETQLRDWVVAATDFLAAVAAAAPPAPPEKVFVGDPQGLAIDGKRLRGSAKRGSELAGLLAGVSHRLAVAVFQAPMPAKEGELTAIRAVLNTLLLEDVVVTVDAQFTQPDVAQAILDRGGDYVMRVKGNQPRLRSDLQQLLSPEHYDPERRTSVSTEAAGHGRREFRRLTVQTLTGEQARDLAWPGAKQVFLVSTQQRRGHKWCAETHVYGVTSLSGEEADAARLQRLYRGHWAVENKGFWVRDVVAKEDASPVRVPNNVAVMACVRGAILNLLRATGEVRLARLTRKLNGDRRAAFRLLGCL